MRKSSLLLRLPLITISVLSLFSDLAKADSTRVTETTDYWFQYESDTQFIADTFQVDGIGSDPMLWLYNSEGVLIASNDDWNGLQSHLELPLVAGTYRLRAGVCCGNPDMWYQGVEYDIYYTGIAISSTSTTSTTVEETTTTSTSTTTTTSTTTSTTTTTVPETTTTTVPATTTTVAPTTTTSTTTSTTTTTVPETTTTSSSTTTTEPLPIISTLIDNQLSNKVEITTTTSSPTTTIPTTTTTQATTTTTTVVEPTVATVVSVVEAVQAIQNADSLSTEQLQEVFADIEPESLTESQKEELSAVLNNASEEVKEVFEESIDVYGGGFDSYVPSGSSVTVGTRRAIIAASGLVLAVPVATGTTTDGKKRK